MRFRLAVASCGIALWLAPSVPGLGAQTRAAGSSSALSATDTPAYDVATIKPNNSGSGKSDAWTHDNAYVTRNFGLKPMLQDAFDVQQNLIYGLPAWAVSARFDVEAKVTEMTLEQLRSLTPQQRRGMLQALLADRFGLKWHMATQTVPVYELELTKDGPNSSWPAALTRRGPEMAHMCGGRSWASAMWLYRSFVTSCRTGCSGRWSTKPACPGNILLWFDLLPIRTRPKPTEKPLRTRRLCQPCSRHCRSNSV